MIVDDARLKHHVELIDSFTSFAVSITFLSAVSLFVLKLCQKFSECCGNLFKKKPKKEAENVPPTRYKPLREGRTAHAPRRSSSAVQALPLHPNAEFQIPGMISCLPVQPILDGSTSSISSNEECRRMSLCSEEFIQPDPNENHPLSRQKMYLGSNPERFRQYSSSFELKECQLIPELYESNVAVSEASSSLGKVKYTLQYEDSSKRKLIMTIHDICNLKFTKGNENVEYLLLSVTLLPEREYVYKTKTLEASTDVTLHDKFSFHSRPRNRDFESRTIIVTIIYIGNSGKEVPYGEARLPLLSHEIYSQVPTEVSVGVTLITQTEIGDAQIQINYSSAQKQLTIILKTIHFSNISVFDKLSGIHIKTYLLVPGEKKEARTKKKSISKTIRFNEARYIEFQDPITFTLLPSNFIEQCTIKMSIHGKHKTLVKRMCMGKIRIGENSLDECGKVHWKHVLSSKEIAWTMWHPIYSN